jgi:hypothetical protein
MNTLPLTPNEGSRIFIDSALSIKNSILHFSPLVSSLLRLPFSGHQKRLLALFAKRLVIKLNHAIVRENSGNWERNFFYVCLYF